MKPVWIKYLLFANAALEGVIGLIFIFYPQLIKSLPGLQATAGLDGVTMLINMYGVAAITLALFSILLSRQKYNPEALSMGVVVFLVFHIGLATTQFIHNPDFRPAVLHSLLAIGFFSALFSIKN
jgi:hypothetical protein